MSVLTLLCLLTCVLVLGFFLLATLCALVLAGRIDEQFEQR